MKNTNTPSPRLALNKEKVYSFHNTNSAGDRGRTKPPTGIFF